MGVEELLVLDQEGLLKKSQQAVETDPLKLDFRNMLWLVWKSGIIPGNPDPTELQYDVAEFLQYGPKRAVIEAFRGFSKSWITSAFVVWLLYCNPQLKILVVSASKERADNFTTFTLRLINEMPQLKHLRPRDDQRCSKVSFDVGPARADHAPSVKSVGVTGQMAGSRADLIIADDIEVPGNSDTQTKRDKLGELVKEFDAILKPNGRIMYLGTPQTEHSIYNELAKRGYVIRIWPVRFPTEDKLVKYGNRLAPYIMSKLEADPSCAGLSTEPTRFTEQDLLERELSYGRSGFALQFMLDTSLSDADRYPLKLRDLIVMPLDHTRGPVDLVWGAGPDQLLADVQPVGLNGDYYYAPISVSKEFAPYEGTIMFIDPSGRGKDETAYVILKQLHGRIFLVDVGAYLGGYDDATLEALLLAAKKFGVNLILNEPNFGGGMFTQLLKAKAQTLYRCQIEDSEWSRTSKEARIIDTLEPVMNQHRLVVSTECILKDFNSTTGYASEDVQRYRLFYQLTRITRDKGSLVQDDRLDALASAVAYFVEQMNRNAALAKEAYDEALLDHELEAFRDQVFVVGGMESRTEMDRSGDCRLPR